MVIFFLKPIYIYSRKFSLEKKKNEFFIRGTLVFIYRIHLISMLHFYSSSKFSHNSWYFQGVGVQKYIIGNKWVIAHSWVLLFKQKGTSYTFQLKVVIFVCCKYQHVLVVLLYIDSVSDIDGFCLFGVFTIYFDYTFFS